MFPEIETERLLLRMYRADDAEAMHRIWTDPDVIRYIDPTFKPTIEETREIVGRMVQRWRERKAGQWVVCLKDDEKVIGYCGFKPLNGVGPETEILYGLLKEYWNKGYSTELTRACLRYVFENTDLDYIVAVAFPENTGSWRVMEKAGMKFEKTTQFFDRDMVLYSISKEEFEPNEASYKLSFVKDDK
jgi:ribosomal-protein-alanine N-acetyltransferase